MTGTLIFLDTETTSLRHDRRVWEIGAVTRRPGNPSQPGGEYHRFIRREDLDLGNADPFSLNIGRYYDRHPDELSFGGDDRPGAERDVLADFAKLARGATIIGNVVNFDTEVLAARCRAHGILWNAHYHLVDVEALAAGWLHRHAAVLENSQATIDEATRLRRAATPPWDSEELSAALGVKVPGDGERHTALGDARWARDMYDAVMGHGG